MEDIAIDHRLEFMNWAIFVIPITALISIYSIFFSKQDSDSRSSITHFPFFSDLLDFQPEYRVFSVAMSAHVALLAILFFTRNSALSLVSAVRHHRLSSAHRVFRGATVTSAALLCVGSFLMSVVPPRASHHANAVGHHLFSLCASAYSVGHDFLVTRLWRPVHFLSRLLTVSGALPLLVHLLLRYWIATCAGRPRDVVWSVASSLELLGLTLMALKFCRMGFDLPAHSLRLTRRIE